MRTTIPTRNAQFYDSLPENMTGSQGR